MKRFSKILLACALVFGGMSISSQEADAGGGFRLIRPQSRWMARTTTRTNTRTQNTWRRSNSTQRITNNTKWPGAIGTRPHRYTFFENVYGYWD